MNLYLGERAAEAEVAVAVAAVAVTAAADAVAEWMFAMVQWG